MVLQCSLMSSLDYASQAYIASYSSQFGSCIRKIEVEERKERAMNTEDVRVYLNSEVLEKLNEDTLYVFFYFIALFIGSYLNLIITVYQIVR